jgi:hypothetical protein
MGLARSSFIPHFKQASRSSAIALAVMAMIEMREKGPDMLRILRVASKHPLVQIALKEI